ncbi:helix-turn-helix transcriptional regulator [Xanthocytophaga agilis]|uniref:LuxR C-terminal-related transcriptional regulator n=1 Tax=Xanthocytophaga agilis TaxID=3048010 RepID=A0AAE3UJD2_9BACT|nr:LuxR C-terminal-related transcriptional regulator [Xanthocytophaga agilis]MDJ1505757.1 LuxR C-terminal-related transcriptional regulator [Xanthocytophaga agilis]
MLPAIDTLMTNRPLKVITELRNNFVILDFDDEDLPVFDMRVNYYQDINHYLSSLNPSNLVTVKCNFPRHNFLEVLYIMLQLAKRLQIAFISNSISDEGIHFLKKHKVTGVFSVNELLNDIAASRRRRANQFYLSNFIQYNEPALPNDLCSFLSLSYVEIKILYLFSRGLSNRQLTSKINKSYHTVKNHKSNIIRKIGIDGSDQLMQYVHLLQTMRL